MLKNKWHNSVENIEDYLGFIYKIEHYKTGKFYIGQKKLWFKKTLPPLKGKKRKRRSLVESDWKVYNSSSKDLQEDIKKYGEDEFSFIILSYCKNKAEMNYLETKEQFDRRALLRED